MMTSDRCSPKADAYEPSAMERIEHRVEMLGIGAHISDVRKQLLGICISVMLVLFFCGGFALFAIFFLTRTWAVLSICALLFLVPAIMSLGYDHGKFLVGAPPDEPDILTRAFRFSIGLSIALGCLSLGFLVFRFYN